MVRVSSAMGATYRLGLRPSCGKPRPRRFTRTAGRDGEGSTRTLDPTTEEVTSDPSHRPAPDGAAAAVRPRPRRGRRSPGAARRQVRRDVDLDELHVPVVQLPDATRRAAVLRPAV